MRVVVRHKSHYAYDRPAALGPHTLRLRPASHTKAKIETYALRVEPPCRLHWQQDPAGNHVARVTFRDGERVAALDVDVEIAVDVRPLNPFDFFIDPLSEKAPFVYPEAIARDLAPYLEVDDPAYVGGERLRAFLADLPRDGVTVDLVVALNRAVHERVAYVIREDTGVFTPEETLREGRASCRDSAVLLVAALRSRGLAARFVSGYLVQLEDEGMIPDEPRGVKADVMDLHAWAEVFLPGAGWIGLDATSGLLAGEGHIPLACTARPAAAAPIEGTSDVAASRVTFTTSVRRLGHEPRPTAPFTEATWNELVAAGDLVDAALAEANIALTVGGEPTFMSRLHPHLPEWNGAALGATKWEQGLALAEALLARHAPGGILLHGQGKVYPGESLPRWRIDILARRDGAPLVRERARDPRGAHSATREDAERLARAVATRLEIGDHVEAAYEDPWHHVEIEARLPVDVDPHRADLDAPEERKRLARVLDRGLARPVGYVVPIAARAGGGWLGDRWAFRRERLYLVPGDSPIGLRLPLASLTGDPPPMPIEPAYDGPRDPRRADEREGVDPPQRSSRTSSGGACTVHGIKTALAFEARAGRLFVFVPPLSGAARFAELVSTIDAVAASLDLAVDFEGYPPPSSRELLSFAVTPDPGVLEVNIPPMRTAREHASFMESLFEAALEVGLHAERYQLDGRQAGSGGGHHITCGGPTALESPFVRRPDLLASLVTFTQRHPSLSYLFTGLFVGPTSQAPRVDEARHDALYELEIALARAREGHEGDAPPPWLSDALFRHLLVDVAGNTHRTEICIDKLFDPQSPFGRQGLVELRAFEMPPHARMVVAQVALVRALVASFARAKVEGPLVRWGQLLHDRFLLPTPLWRDFESVLDHLARAGLPLPKEAYRVFLEHRCPVIGAMTIDGTTLELRNAIEPWHVLGEEVVASGTARYVDSSMERVELRATGLIRERHVVTVNGHVLPMHTTGDGDEAIGGVRFRAWAPPHALHPHIGIHHPLRFELIDTWGERSLGAVAYHVWHPEGRAYEEPPLTRFEASARRAARFTVEGPSAWPVRPVRVAPHADAPHTLDLRRLGIDRPMPSPDPARDANGEGGA